MAQTFVDIELCLLVVLVLGEASSSVVDTGTGDGGCIPALQVQPGTVSGLLD